MLLVMGASGFLLPPWERRTEEQAHLWNETFLKVDIFLPELRQQLFPTPPPALVPVPFQSVPVETIATEETNDLV